MKQDTVATRLISRLSDLLHYSYDTEHYIVTVKEEINYTIKYLDIQKERYKNRLQVILDIDEACYDYHTVKLILQPLVENSIIHGLKNKPDDWRIYLRCFLENNFLAFEISDNGIGIPSENLARLNASIRQLKNEAPHSVGIINIAHRIKLVFGSQCSLQLNSVSGERSTVILKHRATKLRQA